MKFALTISLLLLVACAGALEPTTIQCADCAEAQVVRIVDGDTLETGFGRVRLFGIDAPERGQRCASKATARLRELAGDRVRLEDGPRLTDRFGRALAYVFTEDGMSVDEVLVREGLAAAWTGDGQHRDFLTELEREVRRQGVGCLW